MRFQGGRDARGADRHVRDALNSDASQGVNSCRPYSDRRPPRSTILGVGRLVGTILIVELTPTFVTRVVQRQMRPSDVKPRLAPVVPAVDAVPGLKRAGIGPMFVDRWDHSIDRCATAQEIASESRPAWGNASRSHPGAG